MLASFRVSCKNRTMKIKARHKFLITLIALTGILVYWCTRPQPMTLKLVSFQALPGWKEASLKQSLSTFQNSCHTLLRYDPENPVGSQQIRMKAKDWQPVCKAAIATTVSEKNARGFFEQWFTPFEFYQSKPVTGLFTGYYMELLEGSPVKTKEYSIPLYGLPSNLVVLNPIDFGLNQMRPIVGRLDGNKIIPYYNRKEINHGAIKENAPVLAWLHSHIDRLFLEIQGSGTVHLTNGEKISVGYAGENGIPYTAIGRVLIEQGLMDKSKVTMQGIRSYLEAHPDKIEPIINENKSFVFFKTLNQKAALGAQGIALTPGYSLAVDRTWIPLGLPIWLKTTRPHQKEDKVLSFERLMIAQDTGGAIRGPVRGDVYWGASKKAAEIAGKMKNPGHYWLLLPRAKAFQN